MYRNDRIVSASTFFFSVILARYFSLSSVYIASVDTKLPCSRAKSEKKCSKVKFIVNFIGFPYRNSRIINTFVTIIIGFEITQ